MNLMETLHSVERDCRDARAALADEEEGRLKTIINMIADDAEAMRKLVNNW